MASSSGCAPRRGAGSSPGAAGRGGHVSPPDGTTSDQRFPRSCRLTARRQFLEVYGHGHRVGSKSFTLFGLPNSLGYCRVGLTATRKTGKAARRNRSKRLLREVFRLNRSRLDNGLDIVINAHRGTHETDLAELQEEFLRGFRRLAARYSR